MARQKESLKRQPDGANLGFEEKLWVAGSLPARKAGPMFASPLAALRATRTKMKIEYDAVTDLLNIKGVLHSL